MTLEARRAHILSGRMYNDLADELVEARQRAVLLTTEYNDSFGQPQHVREAILRRLLREVGRDCHFEPTFRCEFGFNISVGDHSYANFDCSCWTVAASPSATTCSSAPVSASTAATAPSTAPDARPAPATPSR